MKAVALARELLATGSRAKCARSAAQICRGGMLAIIAAAAAAARFELSPGR